MGGKVLQDAVIAPSDNWSAVLTPRQTLRIVDLEGKQAVDFLCYNADDVADRHGIYSVRATKLFTIVADTMGGGHDTIGGCCSAASNMFRYKAPDTPSCYANFLRALAPHGMGEKAPWASWTAARSRATTSSCERSRACSRWCRTARRRTTRAAGSTPRRSA